MINFTQYLQLIKESISLHDPEAHAALTVTQKVTGDMISFMEFKFEFENKPYVIDIYKQKNELKLPENELFPIQTMSIFLKINRTYLPINQLGMKAIKVYNILLAAIKQAHDYFDPNSIQAYNTSGTVFSQDVMYHKIIERISPNLILWEKGLYLKPETIELMKQHFPEYKDFIDEKIKTTTSSFKSEIETHKKRKADYAKYLASKRMRTTTQSSI